MGEEEFSRFRERTIARRAAKWVERGIWAAAGAIETCRRDYAAYLPQGGTTLSHHFCTILGGGMRVGEAWHTVKDEGGKVRVGLPWLAIDLPYRRRGYATETLQ